MSKLILGPRVFTDRALYNSGGIIEHQPGIAHWLNSTTNIASYGMIWGKGGTSNTETPPISVAATTQNTFCTLISFETVATAPGAAGSAAQYSDYLRKTILAGGPTGTTELRIYSGTKPASPDLMTTLADYESNLLITMPIAGYSADESMSGFRCLSHKPSTIRPNYHSSSPVFEGMSFMLGVCPTFTNSSNTSDAIATWFWYGNVYGGTSNLADVPFVIGTVGSTASSDLVIPDTVIKPNTAYKSYGFKFEIPVVYAI